jgi:hypothetical protein
MRRQEKVCPEKNSKNFRHLPEIVAAPPLNMQAYGILVDFPAYFTYPVVTGSIKAYCIQGIWFSI